MMKEVVTRMTKRTRQRTLEGCQPRVFKVSEFK
jgi:hypothetical protein